MTLPIAIAYADEAQYSKALELSRLLNCPIDNHADMQLWVGADKLALKLGSFAPLYADFNLKTWQKRRDAGKQQGLVRACKPKPGLRILDVTAGWGRDAAVLASFGAEVTMLERHPLMAVLLRDALDRRDERSKQVLSLTLKNRDAKDYLIHLKEDEYPDVIYLDPMHPAREKAALVKKELQVLQKLVPPDEDALELLQLARTKATQKVVVKWPQQQPPLMPPTQKIEGKTVRFDVYI